MSELRAAYYDVLLSLKCVKLQQSDFLLSLPPPHPPLPPHPPYTKIHAYWHCHNETILSTSTQTAILIHDRIWHTIV